MKNFTVWFVIFLVSATTAFAASDEREEDRVKEAGTVMKEMFASLDWLPTLVEIAGGGI
jgi:hypothetical protein